MLNIVPGINRTGRCPEQLFTQLGGDLGSHTAKHRVNALSTAFRIAAMAAFVQKNHKESTPSMKNVKNLIDATYDDPDLSVTQLADSLNMHRGSLSRAFRRSFDMTVSDYITFVRLNNARAMLENPAYPVKEVAEACGFSSANYFTKVFAAYFGIIPQKYRRETLPRQKQLL